MSHQTPGYGFCASMDGMFQRFKCYRWKSGFITSLYVFQYSLFYLDEGSGDGPDEGYRFGNTHEFTALSLLFIFKIDCIYFISSTIF